MSLKEALNQAKNCDETGKALHESGVEALPCSPVEATKDDSPQ